MVTLANPYEHFRKLIQSATTRKDVADTIRYAENCKGMSYQDMTNLRVDAEKKRKRLMR